MATLPSFITFSAGSILTAAQINNFSIAGNFFLSWPVFEGRQTIAQAITTGGGAAILIDTEDIDTDNGHSTITNTSRYTPQTQGRFQHSGGVGMVNNASGNRWAYWGINTSPINGSSQMLPPSIQRWAPATMTSFFNGTTDYLELFVLQNSGVSLNTDVGAGATGYQSRMSVRMVGTT